MKQVTYKKDSVVIVQNSVNKGFFYILKSGYLVVDSEHKKTEKELSRFVPGDSFGLVSALTGHRFLVSVFAKTDAVVVEVPISMLGTYLRDNKEISIKMMSLYSKELRALHDYIIKDALPDLLRAHPERLLNDAAKYISTGRIKYASYALNKFIEWAATQPNMAAKVEEAQNKIREIGMDYAGPQWTSVTQELNAKEVIFLENEISSEIYVVQSGSVKLFRLNNGKEVIIDVLDSGEIFGEMAFVDQKQRLASAVTDSKTSLMRLTKDNLFSSTGEAVLQRMFEGLARRIWFAHQRLVIKDIKNPLSRLYSYIYNMTRDYDIKYHKRNSALDSYKFNMSFDELKNICNISDQSDGDVIKPLLNDTNIVITDSSIEVKNRKRLEDRVSNYKTDTGQICAQLI